jgi:hypothetical protein
MLGLEGLNGLAKFSQIMLKISPDSVRIDPSILMRHQVAQTDDPIPGLRGSLK